MSYRLNAICLKFRFSRKSPFRAWLIPLMVMFLSGRVSFGSSKGSMVETLIYDCEPAPSRPERDSLPWQGGGRRSTTGRHSGCHGVSLATGGTLGPLPGPTLRVPSPARPPGTAARLTGTSARPTGTAARPLSAPPRPTCVHSR